VVFSTSAGSYLAEDDLILPVLEDAADADLTVRQLFRIGFDHVFGWISAAEAKTADLFVEREERIDFSDFQPAEALRNGEIIDVRTMAEFQRGHLAGARSFRPYSTVALSVSRLASPVVAARYLPFHFLSMAWDSIFEVP
jgi:hypothetical protein